MPWERKTNRMFDEHEFWMPYQIRVGEHASLAYEKEVCWLNLVLTAIETPARFVISYELCDFIHTRFIKNPRRMLRFAEKSMLPAFYFFIGKN